jgi:hypothetical protein
LVVLNFASLPGITGIIVRGRVTADDTMEVSWENTTGAPIVVGAQNYRIALLQPGNPYRLGLSTSHLDVRLSKVSGNPFVTGQNLVTLINGHADLQRAVKARQGSANIINIASVPTGVEGTGIKIAVRNINRTPGPVSVAIQNVLRLEIPLAANRYVGAFTTDANLFGGRDIPVNGGDGTSQLRLTGMTERFPMGILLQDSDFLSENPLGDSASAVKTSPTGIRPVQTQLPLTTRGEEVTRFLGKPGTLLGMADGGILRYTASTVDTPSGSLRFRLYRGGGSLFMLSGENPGGPVDWVSESFPFSLQPVLKGGVLTAKALLVRNFPEEGLSNPNKFSDGDEIQMIIITFGILGNGDTVAQGVTLAGSISPTGYGEGYAASDRYRINGHPMFRGHSRQHRDPDAVVLTPFSGSLDPAE